MLYDGYMVVYLLTNTVNGKRYVGKTTQGLTRRWNEHCGDARSRSTTYLHRAILKYGPAVFHKRVLSMALNSAALSALEVFWIRELNTRDPNGYNLTAGGEGLAGVKRSLETRAKMSKAARNRSPELVAQMRIWGRGHKHTPEAIEKMSAASRGRKASLATRAKMRARMLGHTFNRGRKLSPEHCAKLVAAALGRKDPVETRVRKSAGAVRGWETRRANAA